MGFERRRRCGRPETPRRCIRERVAEKVKINSHIDLDRPLKTGPGPIWTARPQGRAAAYWRISATGAGSDATPARPPPRRRPGGKARQDAPPPEAGAAKRARNPIQDWAGRSPRPRVRLLFDNRSDNSRSGHVGGRWAVVAEARWVNGQGHQAFERVLATHDPPCTGRAGAS